MKGRSTLIRALLILSVAIVSLSASSTRWVQMPGWIVASLSGYYGLQGLKTQFTPALMTGPSDALSYRWPSVFGVANRMPEPLFDSLNRKKEHVR